MKTPFLVALLSFFAVPAFAADVPAVSKIAEVTVYQDRAMVTRMAQVPLEKGSNTILFENLPGALMEESLRAEGSGSVPVTIFGAELKKFFTANDANADFARLETGLETMRDERRELELKQEALAGQRLFLDSVRNFSSAQVPKDIQTKSSSAAEWTGISEYLYAGYVENGHKAFELDKTLREKDKAILAKQREFDEVAGGGSVEKRTVIVNVEAKEKGTFDVRLTYVIPQASWQLSYDAKVSPTKKTCTLVSYGSVRQWTGEDWVDVSLTLSSAKPAIGGRMPELTPWFLDFPAPPVVYPRAMASARRVSMEAETAESYSGASMYDMASQAPVPVKAEESRADVSQDLGTVTFGLPRRVSVLSDNRLYKFPVSSDTLAVEFDYETTPKVSPYAFLHTKVRNDRDYPLIAGEISVFADDAFIGKSSIKTVGKNEKFDLYLGIDEDIKVTRTELVDKRKKTMLGMRARKDYGYKIEIENYKKEAVRVSVYDQLPVSKNNDIKAGMVSSSVKPSETRDLGIMKWDFELASAEKKTLEFQFFVEFPSDREVDGV